MKSSLRWSSGLNPCSVREESISKSNLLLISSHMFCLEMYIQTGMGSSYTYQLAFFTQLIFSVSCNNCRASSLFSDYIVLYCMDVYKYKLTCWHAAWLWTAWVHLYEDFFNKYSMYCCTMCSEAGWIHRYRTMHAEPSCTVWYGGFQLHRIQCPDNPTPIPALFKDQLYFFYQSCYY